MRDERGWRDLGTPEGEPAYVSRPHVERVLQFASTLVFEDVVGAEVVPAQGFGSPPQTLLELDLGDEERRAFWVGVQIDPGDASDTGDRAYYATNPHWPERWTVSLPAQSAELLFAAIEDLAGR
jgi:hypothetical protein